LSDISEIHSDKRLEDGLETLGQSFDTEKRRFLEFWNLVFMQFEQFEDGRRNKLQSTCIDTGMGFDCLVVDAGSVIKNMREGYPGLATHIDVIKQVTIN